MEKKNSPQQLQQNTIRNTSSQKRDDENKKTHRPQKLADEILVKENRSQNSDSSEMKEENTVFMIGLPTTTNQNSFNNWIRNELPELKFKKIRFPKSRQKGAFGFIEFEDEISKDKILELPYLKFENRELKFQQYRTGNELKKYREEVQKRRLYVYGLKASMKKKDLREIFSPFGEINDAYLIMDRKTGKSKCFGYVIFEEVEVADEVASIGYLDFKGTTVRFKIHESKGAKNTKKEIQKKQDKREFLKKKDNRKVINNSKIYENESRNLELQIEMEYQSRRFFNPNLPLKKNQFYYKNFIEFQSINPSSSKYFLKRGIMRHFMDNLRLRKCSRNRRSNDYFEDFWKY